MGGSAHRKRRSQSKPLCGGFGERVTEIVGGRWNIYPFIGGDCRNNKIDGFQVEFTLTLRRFLHRLIWMMIIVSITFRGRNNTTKSSFPFFPFPAVLLFIHSSDSVHHQSLVEFHSKKKSFVLFFSNSFSTAINPLMHLNWYSPSNIPTNMRRISQIIQFI